MLYWELASGQIRFLLPPPFTIIVQNTTSQPISLPGCTVRKVLADFALFDWWRYCKGSSVWRKVSSNRGKWSKISSHRAIAASVKFSKSVAGQKVRLITGRPREGKGRVSRFFPPAPSLPFSPSPLFSPSPPPPLFPQPSPLFPQAYFFLPQPHAYYTTAMPNIRAKTHKGWEKKLNTYNIFS